MGNSVGVLNTREIAEYCNRNGAYVLLCAEQELLVQTGYKYQLIVDALTPLHECMDSRKYLLRRSPEALMLKIKWSNPHTQPFGMKLKPKVERDAYSTLTSHSVTST